VPVDFHRIARVGKKIFSKGPGDQALHGAHHPRPSPEPPLSARFSVWLDALTNAAGIGQVQNERLGLTRR